MPPRKKTTGPTPIDAVKHPADTRKNIPTAELRDFVADDENNPVTVRYPRNPDLAWQGGRNADVMFVLARCLSAFCPPFITTRATFMVGKMSRWVLCHFISTLPRHFAHPTVLI